MQTYMLASIWIASEWGELYGIQDCDTVNYGVTSKDALNAKYEIMKDLNCLIWFSDLDIQERKVVHEVVKMVTFVEK